MRARCTMAAATACSRCTISTRCGGSVAAVSEWGDLERVRDDVELDRDIGSILLQRLAADATRSRQSGSAFVVGVTGSVSVGKSTTSTSLADRLRAEGLEVASLSGDSFLLSNARIDEAGLTMRKGFPETYDAQTMRSALVELRSGHEVPVPVYRHDVYDIVPGMLERVGPAEVVVLDGLHLGLFARDLLDVLVYLHADEATLRGFYTARFERQVADAIAAEAAGEGRSFYSGFASLGPSELRDVAEMLWTSINLVNLQEHIAADRNRADIVVTFDKAHRVAAVVDRRSPIAT